MIAFPGLCRGLLDATATTLYDRLLISAANAIASAVTDEELNPYYIIPSVFHSEVHGSVAAAVRAAAEAGRDHG